MDTLDAILADFLRGQELSLNAFNRLMLWRVPLVPVPMAVHASLVEVSDVSADPD